MEFLEEPQNLSFSQKPNKTVRMSMKPFNLGVLSPFKLYKATKTSLSKKGISKASESMLGKEPKVNPVMLNLRSPTQPGSY